MKTVYYLWVTSTEAVTHYATAASEEGRLGAVYATPSNFTPTPDSWVLAGQVIGEIAWESTSDVVGQAIARVDAREVELRERFSQTLQEIQSDRKALLALSSEVPHD